MAQHQKGALDELHDLRLALGGRQVAGQLQLGDALVGGGRRARDDGVVELADAGFGEGGVPLLVVAEQAGPDEREFVQCMQANGPNSAVRRAGCPVAGATQRKPASARPWYPTASDRSRDSVLFDQKPGRSEKGGVG